MMPSLSARNQAEIERSASEARKIQSLPAVETRRYMNPRADTPFALECAFYLLGDVRGKTVLDLGCGNGENLVPLVQRGAHVLGMDISPELVSIARERLRSLSLQASIMAGDAYATGIPSQSIDVVFCCALIHHLNIPLVGAEILRILKEDGTVILKEPVRFSRLYNWLRKLLPEGQDISEYEHPLTRAELRSFTAGFRVDETRYFRLPFVPLAEQLCPSATRSTWGASHWMIRHVSFLKHFSTCVVTRLRKP